MSNVGVKAAPKASALNELLCVLFVANFSKLSPKEFTEHEYKKIDADHEECSPECHWRSEECVECAEYSEQDKPEKKIVGWHFDEVNSITEEAIVEANKEDAQDGGEHNSDANSLSMQSYGPFVFWLFSHFCKISELLHITLKVSGASHETN